MIQLINQLVDGGVEVYSASGNKEDAAIDLFSLSKAQHIVSASDYDEANETLSTAQDQGRHFLKRQFDKQGNVLKITDGIIEFMPEEIPEEICRRRIRDFFCKGVWYRRNFVCLPYQIK